jgi:NADP-dependent aldehyde dehydrogenase
MRMIALAGTFLAASIAMTAGAQAPAGYPSRSVTIVVPFPPGGGTDTGARIIAQKLSQKWGQPVIVENKGGAAGMLGAEQVSKAKPDGYTLMMGNIGTQSINPTLYGKKMAYNADTAFVPVTLVAELPLVLLAGPAMPAKNAAEVIATAKAKPGKVTYSSSGPGGAPHLAGALFEKETKTDLLHVPYKGGGPAIADLIAGHVDISFATILESSGHVKGGRLRALGVTSEKRSPALPDVPTLAESGLPGFNTASWIGLVAPAGTPKEIIDKISRDVREVMAAADVREQFASQGATPAGTTPEEFGALIDKDRKRYAVIIRERNDHRGLNPPGKGKTVLNGEMFIGGAAIKGRAEPVRGSQSRDRRSARPALRRRRRGGARTRVRARRRGVRFLSRDVARSARGVPREDRADILDIGDPLINRAVLETGLPRARLEGERGRTVGQLRLFAAVVREGSWLEARIDPALPDRKPPAPPGSAPAQHRPWPGRGLRREQLPARVFGRRRRHRVRARGRLSVVVKAHPAHPGTSELVGRAIQAAVTTCGLHEGVFSLLHGAGNWLGGALVADARIKAVGFTGSRAGGLALMKIASERREPIPVYAEMSSINPVLVLPAALRNRGAEIARDFVASLTLGAGQFCTNPGLLIAKESAELAHFVKIVAEHLGPAAAQTMLTPGISSAYRRGVGHLASHPAIATEARGQSGGTNCGQAAFFSTSAASFLQDAALAEEVFGASSVLVKSPDVESMRAILERLEGQLTITLQMDEEDLEYARALLPVLERKAGRLLVNGFPTGVEVAHAMVHGGPFPATSDGRSTSVGSLAIDRFLRPVCYQDFPVALLPAALSPGNPEGIPVRVDGKRG